MAQTAFQQNGSSVLKSFRSFRKFRSQTPTQRQESRTPKIQFFRPFVFLPVCLQADLFEEVSSPDPCFSGYLFSSLLQISMFQRTQIAKYTIAETTSKILLHPLKKNIRGMKEQGKREEGKGEGKGRERRLVKPEITTGVYLNLKK